MSVNGKKAGDDGRQGGNSTPPDGRGPRPTDPNELAKWIVDQTTEGEDAAPEPRTQHENDGTRCGNNAFRS